MAGSVNKVILVGNLGADPEIRRLNSGDPVVNLRLATTESWRDKNSGERKEKTEWHNVVIFNDNLAKVAEQYLKKGCQGLYRGPVADPQMAGPDRRGALHDRDRAAEIPRRAADARYARSGRRRRRWPTAADAARISASRRQARVSAAMAAAAASVAVVADRRGSSTTRFRSEGLVPHPRSGEGDHAHHCGGGGALSPLHVRQHLPVDRRVFGEPRDRRRPVVPVLHVGAQPADQQKTLAQAQVGPPERDRENVPVRE